MKKLLLAGVLTPALIAEISAFDAGNVEIANPYGLTASEKSALKTKQHLEGLSKEYAGVDFKTTKALERIDGLQSLVDDLGDKTHNLETRLSDIQEYVDSKDQAKASEIAQLKNLIYANSREISNLKKAVSELLDVLDGIQGGSHNKNITISTNNTNANLSPAARQKAALKAFEAGKYDEALVEFQALASMKHKPALNNYYAAECAFAKGDYNSAIYHYKSSSDLYKSQNVKPQNEASILLHTAISLQKLGDGVKAKVFLDALKKKYPNSEEAKSIK